MRRGTCGWILACAALVLGVGASSAHAITNVYALQAELTRPGGTLVQYAVAAGGALEPSPPDIALDIAPQDVAVTPDGRFAYVMTSSPAATAIVPFARAADGRLERNGPAIGLPAIARGIIVNPQGTRVYYGRPGGAILWRAIDADDGTLGAERSFPIGGGAVATPYAQVLAMTPDGRNLYAAQSAAPGGPTVVWQSTIDPATGEGTPKTPASVAFPVEAGGPAPAAVGRMAVTPSGRHLYLASDTPGAGIGRWAIEPDTGALIGGTVEAPPGDGYAEAVVALSTTGTALWAPSAGAIPAVPAVPAVPGSPATPAPPERVRQLSVSSAGALAPLAPPAVDYVVSGPARDAVASPDGETLYLGQNGSAGQWSVDDDGTLTHRANAPAPPAGGVVNAGIALSPSQAPVASFTMRPGFAGRVTTFDAAASTDPDGRIARYDWDFGDGKDAQDAGPRVRHVYPTTGERTVTLTVTDADGTSTRRLWTGARMLRNGGQSAQRTRSLTIQPVPKPTMGRSVTLLAIRGRILVRLPGSSRFVPLDILRKIPLGSIIDARRGRARITAEVNAKTGRTESSIFYDWYFKVVQRKGRRPVTEARLVNGSFADCGSSRLERSARGARAAQRRRARSRKRVRRLWGRGTGNFRTSGKRSSATVRGTWWLVEDRCDGTLTRVRSGRVEVRDFRRKKTIVLRSNSRRTSYLAKAP